MRVKDLLKKLEGVDPEAEVVVEGRDHHYTLVRTARPSQAIDAPRRDPQLQYYYSLPLEDGERLVPVFFVGP